MSRVSRDQAAGDPLEEAVASNLGGGVQCDSVGGTDPSSMVGPDTMAVTP